MGKMLSDDILIGAAVALWDHVALIWSSSMIASALWPEILILRRMWALVIIV
jgi:hypothetical protein